MLSARLTQWKQAVVANSCNTTDSIDRMEDMLEEGLAAEELVFVVYDLLYALSFQSIYTRCHSYLEQILLWVCSKVPVNDVLITQFVYRSQYPHTHAFEELLMRYEGPVIPLDDFYDRGASHFHCYAFEYTEALMGCNHVVDTEELRPIYEELRAYQRMCMAP